MVFETNLLTTRQYFQKLTKRGISDKFLTTRHYLAATAAQEAHLSVGLSVCGWAGWVRKLVTLGIQDYLRTDV